MNFEIQTGTDSEGNAVTTTLDVQFTWTVTYVSHETQNYVNMNTMPQRRQDNMIKKVKVIKEKKIKIDNQEIEEVLTVNGVRFSFNDGSWGLIRASSNKPSLVVVTESPTSDIRKRKIFEFIDGLLQKTGKIGKYDQKI